MALFHHRQAATKEDSKKRGRQNRKKEQLPPTLTAWAWINPDIKLVHGIVDLQQRLVGSQKEERQ